MRHAKITKEEINKYLERFEGTVPLVTYTQQSYPNKCRTIKVETELNLEYGLSTIQNIQPGREYKIIGGFEKAKLEDFINFDWLTDWELPCLFNKRLVDKMNALCPNDFIALPVTLINLSDKVEPYENKDFCIVNALNTIDAVDRKKSFISYAYEGDKGRVINAVYKKDPWQGHLIAFDDSIYKMIFHPKLARVLYPSKQFHFYTPDEDNAVRFILPNGYDKESWSNWKSVVKAMAYPEKYVRKSLLKESDYYLKHYG
jgi:hypothetical protein